MAGISTAESSLARPTKEDRIERRAGFDGFVRPCPSADRRKGRRGVGPSWQTAARALDEDIDVDISGAFSALTERVGRRQPRSAVRRDLYGEIQRVDRLEHEANFGAGLAMLDFDDPLPADTDSIGKLLLIQPLTPTLVANRPADIIWVYDLHRAPLVVER